MSNFSSDYLELLKNKINLQDIPFTERGSRLMVLRREQGLSIRLCERWIKRDQKLAAYRARPPILDELVISSTDGAPLPMHITSYPHQLELDTPAGQFIMAFLDTETIIIALPPGEYLLSFLAHVTEVQTDWRGGVLRTIGAIRRTIAYTTNAALLENTLEAQADELYRVKLRISSRPEDGSPHALLFNITPRLGFNRYVPDPRPVLREAAQRWHNWFASAPTVAEVYRPQYYFAWWIMRSGLVSTRYFLTRESLMPSKLHYVGIWQWDAYFHALAYRHVDMHLAQDQIRLQLDHQTPEGQIPDAIHDEGIITHLDFPVSADVTKPPLIAWTAWKLHEHQPDLEFLREIYEPLVRWNRWWYEHNDLDQNGLCEYQHPFSSGLDDSPLWDIGMPVESPDLNTYLYLQQEALGRIAHLIGDREAAQQWHERAAGVLDRMIEFSWDSQAGLFWPRHASQPVRISTPFSLFPLITGQLPRTYSDALVAHLTDSNEFWPQYPVPTVALNDPLYNPQQMWRGPTWANINYLLILGLERSGYAQTARDLRHKTLAMLLNQENIYEYYHPETGQPPPKAAPIFGWSAAVLIELAIEESRAASKEKS